MYAKNPLILLITLSAKPPIRFIIQPAILEIPLQIPLIKLEPMLAALSQLSIFLIPLIAPVATFLAA